MKSLLLLALVVSLRRMVVSCFGFISCLSRLLLCTDMIVAAVLLRSSPMSLRGLLMMFGGLSCISLGIIFPCYFEAVLSNA